VFNDGRDHLVPGRTVSHYRILTLLGAGAMGEVYLAEDQRLGRKLALKVLSSHQVADADRVRRFEHEARAVSALNHPNILTLYDVGHVGGMHFIATEFVDGETVRDRLRHGPLSRMDACEIALQVGAALSAAHRSGIVHRDIKPENVMVRRDGYVKVLDFGIAKLAPTHPGSGQFDGATQGPDVTIPGMLVGTFKYMSPEQARGLPVDARSDIFALGVLLYEMLAGCPPFTGPTSSDVIAALLHTEPAPLTEVAEGGTSRDLASIDAVVARALRKNPDERYAAIDHMSAELKSATSSTASDAERPATGARGTASTVATSAASVRSAPRRKRRQVDSIAVLPIANASRDEELEYLGDGLAENLINNLSRFPRLRVMARSTMYRYKGRDVDPLLVGRELGVRAVLMGRLSVTRDRCRISTELVDAEDGSQLWNAQFDRQRADVLALQEEVSSEMTRALHLRLTTGERLRPQRPVTSNAAAFDLYLKGRYYWNKRSPDALKQAADYFQQAVDRDPSFALGHVGLADTYSLLASGYTAVFSEGTVNDARAAALQALALDETVAEAHASLAFLKFRFDWDWAGAELEFRRALELNPGYAPARQRYAMFLATRRRFDEALAEVARARALDPMSSAVQSAEGRILNFAGRYDDAVAVFRRILQVDPGFATTRMDLSDALMAQENWAEAHAEIDRTAAIIGETASIVFFRAYSAYRQGRHDEVRALQAIMETRYAQGTASIDELAIISLWLGDSDRAVQLLEEALRRRAPMLAYVDVELTSRALRDEPRCRALLRTHDLVSAE
jgi:eukaryotic-like serine/threonine-protein kinase